MPARSRSTLSLLIPTPAVSDHRHARCSDEHGDRAFRVAGSRLWNSLPRDVTTAPILAGFRKRFKTFLFSRSFPS